MKLKYFFVTAILTISLSFLISCEPTSNVMEPNTPQSAANSTANEVAGVVERDINDFVSTQYLTWGWYDSNAQETYIFVIDYAGVLNNYYGLNLNSTFSGKIMEKAMSDGRAEVRISLKAHNVLTYVSGLTNGAWTPLLFGELAASVAGGATATLGDANLDITFINSAPGAPIPEIGLMQDVTRLSVNASAFGPFKAAAGFGPDGTPGHAWLNQVGLLDHVNGHPGVNGFSVEYVKMQPVGRRH